MMIRRIPNRQTSMYEGSTCICVQHTTVVYQVHVCEGLGDVVIRGVHVIIYILELWY
jgi:hypothetical protein